MVHIPLGNDLDANERAIFSRLARFEHRRRIATLEQKFEAPGRRLRNYPDKHAGLGFF
jgi:hypothetical protein